MSLANAVAAAATAVAVAIKDPERLLKGLNPEQREIALHDEGPLLAAAVAGSGKTHALVIRVAYLVGVRGVPASRVLAVTFSRKGADEMNERLDELLGKGSGARIGTFHSLAYEILRKEGKCDGWTVDDRDRYRYCIKDAVGFRELKWKQADVTLIAHYISLCKCDLARPYSERSVEIAEEFRAKNPGPKTNVQRLLAAYERAEELRREKQLLTFDDMLFDAVELLQKDEGVRSRWASRWSYVLQDEAQDQNLGQLLIGELLAKDHRNYMLVGDPAQTIFTWRGARPEKLLGFEEEWGAKKIIMHRCYRCAPEVIEVANRVLLSMDPETRLDTEMTAEKTASGDVTCTGYGDLDEEGAGIAARIKELLSDGKVQPKDIAVLYRTNAQSRAPEEGLLTERVPYRIIGGVNFYERKEVKDLLGYLRLAEGRGDLDDVRRCINAPFRYLGKAFVTKVTDAAKDARRRAKKSNGRVSWPGVVRRAAEAAGIQRRQQYNAEDWADIIENLHARINAPDAADNPEAKPAKILEDIVRSTGYVDWLTRDEGEETTENSRVSNVRELVRAAYKFPSVAELLDYVDTTIEASKEQRKGNEPSPNKVTLTTLHRSKGLGWPVVFVIGANEDILPHARAEELEEERRLFYVGCTRAMDALHVSCVAEAAIGNQVRGLAPSRFLDEAGLSPSFGDGDDSVL
jgi:DNA helicase-2/ATP-dependent DNA helicase PcrA